MDLDKGQVDGLVSRGELWVLAIVLEPGVPRFGPGLFNKVRTYGDQTTMVHKIRDKLYDEQDLYFVVRANDLQSVLERFRGVCKELPEIPLARFFPNHPQHPFLQVEDHASTGNMLHVKPEAKHGFRDWYHYNTFVGYGTIKEHENELKRVKNGELFGAEIQVFPVSKEDSNTYMACLRLPSEIQRLPVGRSVHVYWQTHAMDAIIAGNDARTQPARQSMDRTRFDGFDIVDQWRGDVIEPLPAALKDTISLVIHRPSSETTGARQPKLASNLKHAPFEKVMVKIPVSDKILSRFLACHHDLQHWSKTEVCRELLGGDLMELPRVGLLGDVDKEFIEKTISQGRVNPDIRNIIDGLPNARGRFFTITGPAGSGKSYVMVVLSLLMLKGSKMLYPVHPNGATGEWMPNFHEYKNGTGDLEKELEKREHEPQVLVSCPTNSLTDDNCVKMQHAVDNLFADEPIMIIRVHTLELELMIAGQSHTHHEQNSHVAESEDVSAEGLIEILKEVLEHYRMSLPSATSAIPGTNDSRIHLVEHSLGHRMLQFCGIIPGSPWAVSGKYRNFVDNHQERLKEGNRLDDALEFAFQTDMKQLARDTLARADIVIGTPFVLGTYFMYSSLHPTVVFIDKAGMSQESDLLPLITYYFPKAFGLFGDLKQLGPTILSTKEENVFRGQISISLLSRMIKNGSNGFNLVHQHRLTGNISHFINRLFDGGHTKWQLSKCLDPNACVSKVKEFNFKKYRVKQNIVFLNIPESKETSVGHSWANRANVVIGLNIVYDLVSNCAIPPSDIVILVGYDAQKREYLAEMSRRVDSLPGVKWLDVHINVIESFQGHQAPFVILDFVRSETLGHMRSPRRLNVGMTRGQFGLWCLYNAKSMTKFIDYNTDMIRDMRGLIKETKAGATVKLPGN